MLPQAEQGVSPGDFQIAASGTSVFTAIRARLIGLETLASAAAPGRERVVE